MAGWLRKERSNGGGSSMDIYGGVDLLAVLIRKQADCYDRSRSVTSFCLGARQFVTATGYD